MLDFDALQCKLGVTFRDPANLKQSLIHRSYVNENPELLLESNERLEFLGDAVLGFVIADMIYERFPGFSEGELTRLRSHLVCGETLANVARALDLGEYLYLGHGEEDSGGRCRSRNLACALEAVIGAVLIDGGMDQAKAFIKHVLSAELEQTGEGKSPVDNKSRLQHLIQSEHKVTPVYRTLEEIGPDHAKVFVVEVMLGEQVLGRGCGQSKRAAETEAARVAVEALTEKANTC